MHEIIEMIKLCDYISIHTPLTKETYRMVNDDFFQTLRKEPL